MVFERLRSSEQGLTTAEARDRLVAVGPNDPARRRRGVALREFLFFFANPLVVILLIASLVSAMLGVNASIIALMVVLSVVLNFVQSYRSQRAAERLRKKWRPRPACCDFGVGFELAYKFGRY